MEPDQKLVISLNGELESEELQALRELLKKPNPSSDELYEETL